MADPFTQVNEDQIIHARAASYVPMPTSEEWLRAQMEADDARWLEAQQGVRKEIGNKIVNTNYQLFESFTDLSNRLKLDVLLVRAYESLISRKLEDTPLGDVHHILPTCLGGCDTADNKVRLSVKDHAIAHCLLQAMFVGTEHYKDLAGASRLTNCRL